MHSPVLRIDIAAREPTIGFMHDLTDPELLVLVRLHLQNQHSFVVRRCVQRFLSGELTAREAIERIRRHPGVRDDDRYLDE